MILNISNHSSRSWSRKQINAAKLYGEIKDIPFPVIDPKLTSLEVGNIASDYLKIIMKHNNPVVMLQGEFVFTFKLANLLKEKNITVIAACSERKVKETINKDGKSIKESVFEFVQFREY